MTDPRGALVHLANELAMDGDLSDDDLAIIADAAAAMRGRIVAERTVAERAHVVDTPHRVVVTTADDGTETVDASGMVCGDCGRELVSDVGTSRILVCPRVHGRRPHALRPTDPDGAVHCGG